MASEAANQRAGQILGAILGGVVVSRDVPGAPANTHDFNLAFGDGRIIAAEVTISADREVVEFLERGA